MAKVETWARIREALDSGDITTAGGLAEAAIAGGFAHAALYRLAAMRRQRIGDIHGAAAYLLNAVSHSPRDAEVLTAAAEGLREIGQLTEAIALFDRALAQMPSMVAAWYGRGLALEAAGALDDARDSYRKVIELAPDTAPGFAGYATTSMALGDLEEARQYAVRAYEIAPDSAAAGLALARCELAAQNPPRAIAVLEAIAQTGADVATHDAVAVLTLLGDALDRDGRCNEAFAAYASANVRLAQSYPVADGGASLLARIDEIAAAVAPSAPYISSTHGALKDSPADRHIFLLGYPRSGTTLVEQALASLPGVATLEETQTLAEAEALLAASGLSSLAALSDNEAQRLRDAYWQAVSRAGVAVAGRTFVDMDPSKSLALPLIARLFPSAKVIVMRRDPRDVVWSCFRRAFIINTMTREFTSLDRIARHYDAVMRLTERCLGTLPIDAHTVVYEDLVRDFDGVTRALCTFAGLPWTPDIRDFRTTARRGRVKTMSAAQVRGPLFDGSGQWQRYADKLAPVLPILNPWVLDQQRP